MNFSINHILLWLENGEIRDLHFKPNKVNVLTGASSTGKSTILRIIDYCLCKSSKPSKIPEEIINENVAWYGLNFVINNTTYTIARRKIVEGELSDEYYLSLDGEIPELPIANIAAKELKRRIETEFSIDSELVIPYGGKALKAGSKISFRYFLLFNTQPGKVIDNEDQYFDKMDVLRYREGLDRIFDLALGAINPEAVLLSEELSKVKKELISVERREEIFAKQRNVFQGNMIDLIAKAQNAGLIESGLPTIADGITTLNSLVDNYVSSYRKEAFTEVEELQRQRRTILRKLKNIDAFESNYSDYRKLMTINEDSLAPVKVLQDNIGEILLVPAIAELFSNLEKRLDVLKLELNNKNPFAVNLSSEKNELNKALSDVEESLKLYPSKSPDILEEAQRLMLIGEIKAKLELYTQVSDELDFTSLKSGIETNIKQLQKKIDSLPNEKGLAVDLLQDSIQKYIDSTKSLGVYQMYKASFNEKDKVLQIRRPGSSYASDVGSSSYYLFLHLCLFLGMHDFFLQRRSKYVPQFLMLDQISRPYYEEIKRSNPKIESYDDIDDEQLENDDRDKMREAFIMLDDFITYATEVQHQNFQFIVLEHVSPSFFEEIGMKNFHLVENFRSGNALIKNP